VSTTRSARGSGRRRARPRRRRPAARTAAASSRSTSRSPMFLASLQYASISRSCSSACLPRSRASSVSRRALIEFGTTSG
jgi:hypothetical protein